MSLISKNFLLGNDYLWTQIIELTYLLSNYHQLGMNLYSLSNYNHL